MDDDDDDDYANDSDEEFVKAEFLQEITNPHNNMEKIPTTRVRVWGMASSPGGGVTAVFITLNSTIKPERHTFSGLRCRVLFGQNLAPVDEAFLSTRKLTVEGRAFEGMYGGGPRVPGVGIPGERTSNINIERIGVVEAFKQVAAKLVCSLCGGALEVQGGSSRCARGHVFGKFAKLGGKSSFLWHISDPNITLQKTAQLPVFPYCPLVSAIHAVSAGPNASNRRSSQSLRAN
jgi:hypothetical protein